MRLGACSCLPSEEPASASACPCFGCSWSFSRPDFQVQVGVREKEKDMLGISEGSSQRREQSGVCDESQISWVGCLQTPRRSLFLLTHNAASDICTLWFQRVCACLHTSVLKHWQRLTVIYEMRLQLHLKYSQSSSEISEEIMMMHFFYFSNSTETQWRRSLIHSHFQTHQLIISLGLMKMKNPRRLTWVHHCVHVLHVNEAPKLRVRQMKLRLKHQELQFWFWFPHKL